MYYRKLQTYCLSTNDKKRGINHDIDVVLLATVSALPGQWRT